MDRHTGCARSTPTRSGISSSPPTTAAPARRCAPTPPADRRMLDVIDKGDPTDEHPAPLLFVHGAWHAAWCWDEHFLDFFAGQGFAVHALSLQGHGASEGGERLRWT